MSSLRSFHEVTPLLRLFDDYANVNARRGFPQSSLAPTNWTPKFDIREVKDAYELYGELPGLAQENLHVQLEDPQTLSIHGHTERRHSEVSPSSSDESHAKQPSVEDAEDDSDKKNDQTSTEVAKQSGSNEVSNNNHHNEPKYIVAERAIGDFHRSWKFPSRLDQDNIKASLKDGILTIVIPKLKPQAPKKITIQ